MEVFNNPILSYNILYNLKPSEILRNCSINRNISYICNDEYMWAEYCKRHYFINIKRDVFTWREIAIFSEKMLTLLFKHKIYPSYRILQIYTLMVEELKIDELVLKSVTKDQEIISYSIYIEIGDVNLYDYSHEEINDLLDKYGFDEFILSDKPDLLNSFGDQLFDESSMKYYKYIMDLVRRPTKYFVNKVIQKEPYKDIHTYITMDFDVDMNDYIYNQSGYEENDVPELVNLHKMLQTNLKSLFIQYFTDIVFQ